jgi:DNA-binding response OmpR family regulator
MKILIAEDNDVSRRILQLTLAAAGHEVVVTQNGVDAVDALDGGDAPKLAVLDWMMPQMDGLEAIRRIRARQSDMPVYIILLTAKGGKTDIVQGLEAGASDYVVKPFDRDELLARVKVGETVVRLQQKLSEKVKSLEDALVLVKQLQGILPICSYCKNVRDDQNYWQGVETYISSRSEAEFSHSICPSCYDNIVQLQLENLNSN